MADSVEAVREFSPNEIGKMTNAQLKHTLTTLLHAERREDPPKAVLFEELRNVREEIAEMKKI